MEFDEDYAIKYINDYLAKNNLEPYPSDEILNVIDMIWDYYEENDLLTIDSDDDNDDISGLVSYIENLIKKDKLTHIKLSDIKYIVEGELAYEQSIGLID